MFINFYLQLNVTVDIFVNKLPSLSKKEAREQINITFNVIYQKYGILLNDKERLKI